MDIDSPRKSRLIYQSGDQKTRGVVDLRCFAHAENSSPRLSAVSRRNSKKLQEIAPVKPTAPEVQPTSPTQRRVLNPPANPFSDIRPAASLRNKVSEPEPAKPDRKWAPSAREKLSRVKQHLPHGPRLAKSRPADPFNFLPRRSLFRRRRNFARFTLSSFLIPIIIFSFAFAQSQLEEKGRVLGESTLAYDNLKSAAGYALSSDFEATSAGFDSASFNFSSARDTINNLGFGVGEVIAGLPVDTPLSTAQNLAQAGENISLTGKDLSSLMEKISSRSGDGLGGLSGLDEDLASASAHLNAASTNLKQVDTKYIPESMRDKISLAQSSLPVIAANFSRLEEDYPQLMKMLGRDHSQKYLLLFENNSEMRATGGFIGSYGILDIDGGHVKDLTIDGIFNPDGQLKEKVVPPMPIQKISSSWSMHDSNWFADFPTSAKKTALFYEKTGGPTVDGVIAITPELLKQLLEVTGPIDLPAYGVTITADNFVAQTQTQVEQLYDKSENKPKKILSDLAPLVIHKLFQDESLSGEAKAQRLLSTVEKIDQSMREKQILVYHRDPDVESMLEKRGWAGEIIQNPDGDYLSVVNSNINGYKTDAMIDESIDLKTEVQPDGTLINTLTVKRKHNGGQQSYDWYNRVNADYMRVYVPQGSVLLSATGGTVEEYNPPMDYSTFKTDPDVAAEESTIKVDPQSGTQVFQEAGKTVFGNWVYVSPQEEVTVTYRYQLPFKLNFSSDSGAVGSLSTIVQKQAGSVGSSFTASLDLPKNWQVAWNTQNLHADRTVAEKLSRDLIYGAVFIKG